MRVTEAEAIVAGMLAVMCVAIAVGQRGFFLSTGEFLTTLAALVAVALALHFAFRTG